MNNFTAKYSGMSDYTPQEIVQIESAFNRLLDSYMLSNASGNREKVEKAFRFAFEAHKGMRRRSGEPYIFHPIAVAQIVSEEIGLGATSIASALLHDVVEDTEHTPEEIEILFGEKVAGIVIGLTKLKGTTTLQAESLQAENFRKLLLTMSDDIRVILIKIADRLHNMRTLDSMPPRKQYRIAAETLYVYGPLAHRLGLFNIKSELEDLSFRYEQPDKYNEILKKIDDFQCQQEELFNRFAMPIRKKLSELGYDYEIKTRVKSVYSIYRKMNSKNVAFEEIFDIMATRIVFKLKPEFDEKLQCWSVYTAITSTYRPKPERLRDWVSMPKANGYEALHTTVMGPEGRWFEVQIRSERMDEIAEKGYAAHWKYKDGTENSETELEKWLRRVREFLEKPEADAIEFLDDFKANLFSNEIMVFTPKGEMKVLPQGATALDFAFEIHSELGFHCIGAKVNHRTVPLSYVLTSGDQVEILTAAKQSPKEEWLDFVKTGRAKAKIKDSFKEDRKKLIREGEKLLDDELRKLNLVANSRIFKKLLGHYSLQKKEELLFKIGKGVISIKELPKVLKQKPDSRVVRFWKLSFGKKGAGDDTDLNSDEETTKRDKKTPLLITDDFSESQYTVSECCHPLPGDPVIGIMDDEGHVELHHRKCDEAIAKMAQFGNRLVEAKWTSHKLNAFLGVIKVNGLDRVGILAEMAKVISNNQSVNMRSVNIETHDGVFDGKFDVYVHDVEDLNNLIYNLGKIKGITSVKRMEFKK